MERQPEIIQTIQNLIANDKLDKAIKLLMELTESSPFLNELLHQSGRYSELKKQIRTGVIADESASVVKNQIRAGLLAVLSKMMTYSTEDKVAEELSNFETQNPGLIDISESGASTIYGDVNISGKFAAGRDIQIGNERTKNKKPFWKFW
jgi:hypothetical protein